MRIRKWFVAMLLGGCAGAAGPSSVPPHNPGGKGDQISPSDDPNQLIDGASFKLADNITAADVGQTFGTDDGHIPYPDTYWPMVDEGIDNNWSSTGSPLEKYMGLVDSAHLMDAKMWEHTNHGKGV